MSWAIGYDDYWNRDVGYGVPAVCDHPHCNEEIDRGLSNVCGDNVYGGEHGCGLFFCSEHKSYGEQEVQQCERCINEEAPFTPKSDIREWIDWKLNHHSWKEWREKNPEQVTKLTSSNRP